MKKLLTLTMALLVSAALTGTVWAQTGGSATNHKTTKTSKAHKGGKKSSGGSTTPPPK